MRMIRRHRLLCKPKVAGEIQFINKAVRCCCLICNIGTSELRLRQLMQQGHPSSYRSLSPPFKDLATHGN